MMEQPPEDAAIRIENSPEYLDYAHKIDVFLRTLPLTPEQHNELVGMLAEHQTIGRQDAFRQAVRICGEFHRWLEDHPGEEEPPCPIM